MIIATSNCQSQLEALNKRIAAAENHKRQLIIPIVRIILNIFSALLDNRE